MVKVLWALLLLPAPLFAQSERANLTGTVSDPSGAPIGNATVSVVHLSTNTTATVKTTPGGDYNVSNLSPGLYRVEISAVGFKRFVREDVTLTAAGTVRLDAELSLGQVTETVQVSAAVTQIQTENAKISTAVQNRMVDELPLVVGGALRSPFMPAFRAVVVGSGKSCAASAARRIPCLLRAWLPLRPILTSATYRATIKCGCCSITLPPQ